MEKPLSEIARLASRVNDDYSGFGHLDHLTGDYRALAKIGEYTAWMGDRMDSYELWRDQAVTAAATAVQAAGEVQQETLLTAGMAEALGQIGVIGRSVETLRKRALAQGEVTIDNADAGGWLIPAGNTVVVTLPYELIDTDYAVAAEIILAEPGVAHAGQVVVTDRAVNGFTLRVTGAARNIVVRWTLLNPRQLYQ